MFDYIGRQGDGDGIHSGQELIRDQEQNAFTNMYKLVKTEFWHDSFYSVKKHEEMPYSRDNNLHIFRSPFICICISIGTHEWGETSLNPCFISRFKELKWLTQDFLANELAVDTQIFIQ